MGSCDVSTSQWTRSGVFQCKFRIKPPRLLSLSMSLHCSQHCEYCSLCPCYWFCCCQCPTDTIQTLWRCDFYRLSILPCPTSSWKNQDVWAFIYSCAINLNRITCLRILDSIETELKYPPEIFALLKYSNAGPIAAERDTICVKQFSFRYERYDFMRITFREF